MTDQEKVKQAIESVKKASAQELANNPQALKGKCVLRSPGYYDCIDDMTESACKKQATYTISAKWYVGERC